MMLVVSSTEFLWTKVDLISCIDRLILFSGGVIVIIILAIIFFGICPRREREKWDDEDGISSVGSASLPYIPSLGWGFSSNSSSTSPSSSSPSKRVRPETWINRDRRRNPTFFFFVVTVRRITDMLVQCLIRPAHIRENKYVIELECISRTEFASPFP